jgi:hypothetical protein
MKDAAAEPVADVETNVEVSADPTKNFVTIVLWSWPAGELLSHGPFSVEPQRDTAHRMAKHRFLADVPTELADQIVRLVPGCERL